MDSIIKIAQTISEKFILCEFGYANKELDNLSQLLLQRPDLLKQPKIFHLFEELVKAQEKKNYLYIADLLSYRLIPLLSAGNSSPN